MKIEVSQEKLNKALKPLQKLIYKLLLIWNLILCYKLTNKFVLSFYLKYNVRCK